MDLASVWTRITERLRRVITQQEFEVWFTGIRLVEITPDSLVIEAPNDVYADWIRESYAEVVLSVAQELLGGSRRLEVKVNDGLTERPALSSEPPPLPRALGINPDQRFENFVIGECNKFAHAAAAAVAERPDVTYNPLFIYGSTGLGKTHLMHAIANEILASHQDARVIYVTAENFMNEMIDALRLKRMEEFRSKYRQRASLLLVDDVQSLSGRDRTQEEFFHTFNALLTAGHQIVLTSDVLPKDIDKLEPRLRTRFEGGLLADMAPPDRETLVAILLAKAAALGLEIPPDLADAVSSMVKGNIRELEGVLHRLAALTRVYHQPPTLALARQHLPSLFDPVPVQVTVSAVIEAVARVHNLRSVDLTGHRRSRSLANPRQIAMYLARKHTGASFPELGREFDRDHSTIQHGCRKVDDELKSNPDLAAKIRLIEQTLGLRH